MFTRQLATMLSAGISLLPALEALSRGGDDEVHREVVDQLASQISQGQRLSKAMSHYPLIFPPVYLAVVRVGEETGKMVACLSRVADWLEREVANRHMLKAALLYPCFILGLTGSLSVLLFYWVLPGLLGGLPQSEHGLPLITRLVLGVSQALQNPALWLVALGLGGEAFLASRRLRAQPEKWRRLYSLLLSLPVLGPLLRDTSLVRFCGSLEAMLAVGSTLPVSLKLAATASDNPVLQGEVPSLVAGIMEGDPLARCLARHPRLFPPMLTSVLSCGEEAGNLRKMLQYLEATYQEQAYYRVEALKAISEPILLTTVSVVVGTVILAVFLPLYGSLSSLSG